MAAFICYLVFIGFDYPGIYTSVITCFVVALSTEKVEGDAVLPVVVADARYLLPDGSEGRTSATFAVGVPDGEELAHFAVDNPSGLNEGVVAKPLGEMEKA